MALSNPVIEVVDVSIWEADEEFPIHPVGSKPKQTLVCPSQVHQPFLIPGHRYLFKTAIGWQAQQAWSEVIAYQIGASAGLPVPPCFMAFNDKTGETGALVEFFYGYPYEQEAKRLIHARELLARVLVDKKRGRPHNLRMNLVLSRLLCKKWPAVEWWAKTVAFDTLIGNTDRHPDNWGWLARFDGSRYNYQMAPIFDNGTSLGYQIKDDALIEAMTPERLAKFVARGTHHFGWTGSGPEGHFDVLQKMLRAEPRIRPQMIEAAAIDLKQLGDMLDQCVKTDVGLRFSRQRADFVFSLTAERKRLLDKALEATE